MKKYIDADTFIEHCCNTCVKNGVSYGTDSVIIENRFCPMCGKRLEVEPC